MKDRSQPTKGHVVNIGNQTDDASIDQERLRRGVCLVLQEHHIDAAVIGLAIVTDASMQEMNRKYLQHDYPTDVLSFPLEIGGDGPLEGELAISFDTASRRAAEYQWSAEDELLLYAIHGTLHLVGFTDDAEDKRKEMQAHERKILEKMGVLPHQGIPPSSKSDGRVEANAEHVSSQDYNNPHPLQ